jgi:uncharacterized protein (DUF736 family)
MIIGTFKPAGSNFAGTIQTLNFKVEAVFEPITGKTDKAPDYRITTGHTDLGAAWKETSQAGKPYLAVKLDAPGLSGPIHCRLVQSGEAHSLMWTRETKRNHDA